MSHAMVLAVHIAAGGCGLVFGVPAMRAAVMGSQRNRSTVAYQAAVTVLTVTALALAAMSWNRLWAFAAIAVATEVAVVGAWWTARRRLGMWRPWYVRLLCGSYVSLVTALLVVSWGSLSAWVLPTVVGTVLVERAASHTPLVAN